MSGRGRIRPRRVPSNIRRLLRRQVDKIALNLRADDDGFARQMRLDVVAHFLDKRILVGGGKVASLTLQAKTVGLSVRRKKLRWMIFSSGASGSAKVSAGLPVFRCANLLQQVLLQ